MYYLAFLIVLVAILYLLYYLCRSIYKLNIFDKINNKIIRVIVSIIVPSLLLFFFDIVNSFIIYIHLVIFLLIIKLIFYFINNKLLKKKKILHDKTFYISLVITIIYFMIGAYLNYHVFETKYTIYTNKDIGTDRFRIAQISDAHMGTTFNGKEFQKYIDRINESNPDIVVITGDFIDDGTSKQDMIDACNSLEKLRPKYGTYFIYGNHDLGYYNREYSKDDLVNCLFSNNVIVLEDEVELINDYIYIIGRNDKRYGSRKSINSLTKDLDKSKYIIDLNHQPNDYKNESEANIDLVLSGHTHGGQMFPLGYVGILIKANDEYYGLHKIKNTNFIVNSGISSWEIHFKTGTKSEYVIVDVINN